MSDQQPFAHSRHPFRFRPSSSCADSDSLPRSECTAKPAVKYADHMTTSPDPSSEDASQVQRSRSHHTDNDHDNDGGHHSPSHPVPLNPFPDSRSKSGRRTSAQSFRRRTTFGSRPVSVANTVATQDQGASQTTMLERVRTNMSTLLVPGHKVGKPPGFVRELKTILFGSCACPAGLSI